MWSKVHCRPDVQSFNPAVTHVKIAFDPGANFFDQNHESPQKPLTYSGPNGEEFASTTVYGRAPDTEQSQVYKYTVTGIGGGPDEELDPEIAVVLQPGGSGPSGAAGGG